MTPIIGREYATIVVPLIDAAKRNIEICVYDWRCYPERPQHPVSQFNQALLRASRRGVQVRAVVNHGTYVPNILLLGVKVRQLKDRRVLHSKIVLIDGSIVIIGSHNFTSNAFTSNLETSLLVEDLEIASRFSQFFVNLYGL